MILHFLADIINYRLITLKKEAGIDVLPAHGFTGRIDKIQHVL